MNLEQLANHLEQTGISAREFLENTKASEKYVRVTFTQDDGFEWDTIVPYYIRRSGLFIETERELAEYLVGIKQYFTQSKMAEWRDAERRKWDNSKARVTKEFFYKLLSFKEETEFPLNDNPARRIQDIKEAGYTLASVPNACKGKTSRILLPIPLNAQRGYETFTRQFKARVIRLLNARNSYEAKKTNPKALIPDHKFSEVRWDDATKAENSMEMSDEEIIQKFQLLDNQRNQQKREVCRKCFQEGIRGSIYGIDYFYKGGKEWDKQIPILGKEAEKGCIGCPWYDIEEWRAKLNALLDGND